jgi:hypothetical protein
MSSFSITESTSFTIAHARHIASKVATDLMRFRRFYRQPTEEMINRYEAELVELLKGDFVDTVTYGLKRNGVWIEAINYRSVGGGTLVDSDPGGLKPGTNIDGSSFGSFLETNAKWGALSQVERDGIRSRIALQRTDGTMPGVESGYWATDYMYSAAGRGISRSVLKRT